LEVAWDHQESFWGVAVTIKNHFGHNLRTPRIILGAAWDNKKSFSVQSKASEKHFGCNLAATQIMLEATWTHQQSFWVQLGTRNSGHPHAQKFKPILTNYIL